MGDHHHYHSHASAGHHHNHGRAFAVATLLNVGFVAVEFSYGLIAHSTALMADAGHNLSDVLGLLLAWSAMLLGRRQPSDRYTYGLRSTSILAALANAMLLLSACGAIALEAVRRIEDPPPVAGLTVLVVAAVGVAVNGISAWLFIAGSQDNYPPGADLRSVRPNLESPSPPGRGLGEGFGGAGQSLPRSWTAGGQPDMNVRGAFLHMAADAAVSLGVVIAGAAMFYADGLYWLDPAISLVIVAIVLLGTWGLLRDALHLALSAVPPHIDMEAVSDYLASLPGVAEVHDLHVWGMSTTESALTAHLVMPNGHPGDNFIDAAAHELKEGYAIHHSTLQIELGQTAHVCSLEQC